MRVPSVGMPLYERLIVREAKQVAERILADYSVDRFGRLVHGRPKRAVSTMILETLATLRLFGASAIQSLSGGNRR